MKREETIKAISDAVLRDRQKTYGPPEQSFNLIAEMWQAYLCAKLRNGDWKTLMLLGQDVAAMMMLMKTARIALNPAHQDNWTDAGGYAVCGAELASLQNIEPAPQTDQRDPRSPVTFAEAQAISQWANKLSTASPGLLTTEDNLLITDGMLRPTTFSWMQYTHIRVLCMKCFGKAVVG